jgi:hypothetical protein
VLVKFEDACVVELTSALYDADAISSFSISSSFIILSLKFATETALKSDFFSSSLTSPFPVLIAAIPYKNARYYIYF